MHGRIDRIDRAAGGQKPGDLIIWDYKTGSTWKYIQEPRPFWQGRVIQHALYTRMMEERVKGSGGELAGARVARFGYFFPSEKGGGERIELEPAELAGGIEVLDRLVRLASSGAFLATNDAKSDCNFCDYLGVCGNVTAVTCASDRKLAAAGNDILAPFAELRSDG